MVCTKEQLKFLLAQALPDKLVQISGIADQYHWRDPSVLPYPVRETEWLAIVEMVEEKLTGTQQVEYINAMRCWHEFNDDLRTVHWFAVVTSKWYVRAEALVVIGALHPGSAELGVRLT